MEEGSHASLGGGLPFVLAPLHAKVERGRFFLAKLLPFPRTQTVAAPGRKEGGKVGGIRRDEGHSSVPPPLLLERERIPPPHGSSIAIPSTHTLTPQRDSMEGKGERR